MARYAMLALGARIMTKCGISTVVFQSFSLATAPWTRVGNTNSVYVCIQNQVRFRFEKFSCSYCLLGALRQATHVEHVRTGHFMKDRG